VPAPNFLFMPKLPRPSLPHHHSAHRRVSLQLFRSGQICRPWRRLYASQHPDQLSRSSYVDDNSCLFVSSLPSLFYTMTSLRDIYIYEMLRNEYTVPTRCRHRGGMVNPLGCKACRSIRRPISDQINYLITRSKIIQNQSVFCH
jgi:hypothetical protein